MLLLLLLLLKRSRDNKYVYGFDGLMVTMGHGFILISKLTKLYTLNTYSFLHVNHISVNGFKKARYAILGQLLYFSGALCFPL